MDYLRKRNEALTRGSGAKGGNVKNKLYLDTGKGSTGKPPSAPAPKPLGTILTKTLTYILSSLLCCACSNSDQSAPSNNGSQSGQTTSISSSNLADGRSDTLFVDKIYIGMTLSEMQQHYATCDFAVEPVSKYGVDGEANGITVIDKGDSLFFVWTLEGKVTIHGITILSPKIKIDNNEVNVGMTVRDYLKKYPNSLFAIDMIDDQIEYIYNPTVKYRLEFLSTDSTRVGQYNITDHEPTFISIRRLNAKVDRIALD